MRLSRVGWGVVAAWVSGATLVVVQPLEARYMSSPLMRLTFTATAVAGLSVLWLADYFGMMSPPYGSNTLDLVDQKPSRDSRPANEWREGVSDFAWYVWTIIQGFSGRRR